MNAALIEGDAQKMEEERLSGVSDLLRHAGAEEPIPCFAGGGVSPSSAVEDATLLMDEGGMTVNLQNRLKNLFEFEFADDAVDEKSLQAFTLTEEESGFLNRAIKTQSDAEEARARGDIANALLLADGSALIVSAIHARYMCAK